MGKVQQENAVRKGPDRKKRKQQKKLLCIHIDEKSLKKSNLPYEQTTLRGHKELQKRREGKAYQQ